MLSKLFQDCDSRTRPNSLKSKDNIAAVSLVSDLEGFAASSILAAYLRRQRFVSKMQMTR